jgi:DNA-binding SARP family transcriptional activator
MNDVCLADLIFDPPGIPNNDRLTEIQRRKTLAVLAYLAVTWRLHSRDTRAAFFWPDTDRSSARRRESRENNWLV